MTQHVPRTLEAMLLHALAPAAAELLTQKLEQADAQATAAGDHCFMLLHDAFAAKSQQGQVQIAICFLGRDQTQDFAFG